MIILASKSPRRKELLKLITDDFIIKESNFDESSIKVNNNYLLAETLAFNKANEVKKSCNYNDIIIGSDTIVLINNEVLGKPKDKEDAKRMINLLKNNVHEVITGLSVLYQDKIINKTIISKVYFDDISNEEIDEYLKNDEYKDKAGAYAIQGLASKFIKKIEGDYFTIVGLPVHTLYRILYDLQKSN